MNAIQILDYKHLIKRIAISDFKLRYRNTVLGFFWSLLEPLLMLLVLYLVFTRLMRMETENYALFLLMGIVSWNFLAKGTQMSLHCILNKPGLVKHVYLPKEILVISSCLTALMMAVLEFLVFGIFMLFFGVRPGLTAIYFPLILSLEFILILGLSFGLSTLNVYYRDVQYIWGVILQIGFFATPIIYPMSILPKRAASLIMLNPMTRIIEMFRGSLIYNRPPTMADLSYAFISSIIILFLGYLLFLKLEPRLAEEM